MELTKNNLYSFLKNSSEIGLILQDIIESIESMSGGILIDDTLFARLNTEFLSIIYQGVTSGTIPQHIFDNLKLILDFGLNISKFIIGVNNPHFNIDLTNEYLLIQKVTLKSFDKYVGEDEYKNKHCGVIK
jgi:hypothetical protein